MRAVARALALAACCSCGSRGGPCELEVRATIDPAAPPNSLECAAESLRIRLEAVADQFEPRVRVENERTLLIEIASEPDELELDELRALIAHVPTFGVAMRIDDAAFGAQIDDEFARLKTGWSTRPGMPLEHFNRTPRDQGGPAPTLAWALRSAEAYSEPMAPLQRCWPCIAPPMEPATRLAVISASDLARVEPELMPVGNLAIELVWKPERAQELAAIVASYPGRIVCWLVDGEIAGTQHTSYSPGAYRIQTSANHEHRDALLRALRSAIAAGSSPAQLEFASLRKLR